MDIKLLHHYEQLSGQINLNASKSESNRVLIMSALSSGLEIENLSEARDTITMERLLREDPEEWDVLDAGTTMRFCVAYLGINGRGQTITGTDRMKQRPIGLLVDALRTLGAKIQYLEKEGYPPLYVKAIAQQQKDQISIPGNVSSQYISALLMIAPRLPKGLQLQLIGEIFSLPYIEMTLKLMSHFGIRHEWEGDTIVIAPQEYVHNHYRVESDWSGASYWFAMTALDPGSRLQLNGLRKDSYQGDQAIAGIMQQMGVGTSYNARGIEIFHTDEFAKALKLDFRKCPDLAQTVMLVAGIKGIDLEMTGLESLRIKETDRIAAMRQELAKIGTELTESNGKWVLTRKENIPENIAPFDTYEDHRMAMALAPACLQSNIVIREPEVVQKSYPAFWEDLRSVGIRIENIDNRG